MQLSKTFVLVTALACASAPVSSMARVYTVGADSACSHRDIEAALVAAKNHPGRDEVRLARNIAHIIGPRAPSHDDVLLSGGFSACSDHTALGYTRLGGTEQNVVEWLSRHSDVRGVRAEASIAAVASTSGTEKQR